MSTYANLNAEVNLWGPDGELQLHKDKEAAHAYFLEHVNQNTVFFHSLEEKVHHLCDVEQLWSKDIVLKYGMGGLKTLMKRAYGYKFRFPTFMGAYKFYNSYALKTPDRSRYYERFEDRVVLSAVHYSEELEQAERFVDVIMRGYFQPATPTFLNAGLLDRGEPVSCFELHVSDDMESIARSLTDALQLSKRGGGVGLGITDLREAGAPIKGVDGQASGIIPVMKLYEDAFSYANQLGQRQGAGVVYLHAHHPEIMKFLDTKRENADEKIRIKTLSLGVVVPDITFELARNNEDMYLFSPYDVKKVTGQPLSQHSVTDRYREWVDDPRIRKTKVPARLFFQELASVQFESGYPYVLFDDNVNRANPAPNVGRISQSNLCSEVMQPQQPSLMAEDGDFILYGRDVSCNLGSFNIARVGKLVGPDFENVIETGYQFLHQVAKQTNMTCSPTVERGNDLSRAIGVGQMNLHGALLELGLDYDSDEARAWFNTYMHDVTLALIRASVYECVIQGERPFHGWEKSAWEARILNHVEAAEEVTDSRIGNHLTKWGQALDAFRETGMANQHLQAIPPTGSISYINHATASIHPVTAPIEIRKEAKTGRVYYPQYGVTSDNIHTVRTAFDYGPNPIIDMYKVATAWIDQGASMTLFFTDQATTRDVNRAQVYAHKQGLKSIYYIRLQQAALDGLNPAECVSCML